MISSIEVDEAGSPIVTLARADGDALVVGADGDLVADTSGFGIDTSGQPYFDTDGAAIGERAAIGIDASGGVFLERSGS